MFLSQRLVFERSVLRAPARQIEMRAVFHLLLTESRRMSTSKILLAKIEPLPLKTCCNEASRNYWRPFRFKRLCSVAAEWVGAKCLWQSVCMAHWVWA